MKKRFIIFKEGPNTYRITEGPGWEPWLEVQTTDSMGEINWVCVGDIAKRSALWKPFNNLLAGKLELQETELKDEEK